MYICIEYARLFIVKVATKATSTPQLAAAAAFKNIMNPIRKYKNKNFDSLLSNVHDIFDQKC